MKRACVQSARTLRKHSTLEERRLWQQLRNQKMGGLKFRRQHPFGPYILDFYCTETLVNIELDGGQHASAEHEKQDEERDAFLASEGVKTIRVWNRAVRVNLDGGLQQIAMELGLKK